MLQFAKSVCCYHSTLWDKFIFLHNLLWKLRHEHWKGQIHPLPTISLHSLSLALILCVSDSCMDTSTITLSSELWPCRTRLRLLCWMYGTTDSVGSWAERRSCCLSLREFVLHWRRTENCPVVRQSTRKTISSSLVLAPGSMRMKELSLRQDPDLRKELALLARGCDFVLPSRFKKRLRAFQQGQAGHRNSLLTQKREPCFCIPLMIALYFSVNYKVLDGSKDGSIIHIAECVRV